MEAYKYFLEGKEDIDNLYAEGARKSLEKAVELDPQFAMAYLYLGDAYGELGDRAARDEAYKKAKNHSAKATEKERLYIEAQYANRIERDSEKRLRIYKELAEKYPKEKEAHYELGFYYQNRGMFEEAIEEYQKALQLDPNMGHVLNQLGYTYSDMGDYEKAIYYFKRYAEANPEDANPIDSMAEQYFRMGQLDEAIEKYKEALDVQPDFGSEFRIAYIYALKEDYSETMRWLDLFIDRAPSAGLKGEGHLWKGIFDFLLGKRKNAFVELSHAEDWADKAGNVTRKASLDYTRGWMCYDLGDFERSSEYLQKAWDVFLGFYPESKGLRTGYNFCLGLVEVKEKKMDSSQSRLNKMRSLLPELETPSDEKESKAEHDWLYSEILLAKGSLAEAIEIFENIVYPPLPNMRTDTIWPYNMPFIQDTLARIYYQNGDLEKAIAEYERMITFDPQSSDRHLIHPKCHYLLAKLHEEKGLVAKAIEQYEIFLELWKNADAGQPEFEDAKKRLTSLQSL